MAFENFIPTVWSAEIMTAKNAQSVFAEDCNRDFEGEVKKMGESVKILGVGSPTITVISKNERKSRMPSREEIEDTSIIMTINRMAIFHYDIDDIDEAQMKGNVKTKLNQKTSAGIADEEDKYIAQVCAGKDVPKLFATPKTLVSGAAGEGQINILTLLDVLAQKLYENNVPTSTPLVCTLSPGAHRLFKEAYGDKDTDNHELMKHGKVGMYHNITIKMSNNVHKTVEGSKTVQNISFRTREAVAFANPHVHTEAYRPENGFSDAIKGYSLFDAMVVLPDEIYNANVIVPDFAA